MRFKEFLINEDKVILGKGIGDILGSVHELMMDSKGMGSRQTIENLQVVSSQIRRILHSNWAKEEEKYLVDLQKIGVYIMKNIDEKTDLQELIKNTSDALEKIMEKLGVPQNNLASPETPDTSDDNKSLAPPQGRNIPQPTGNSDQPMLQSGQNP